MTINRTVLHTVILSGIFHFVTVISRANNLQCDTSFTIKKRVIRIIGGNIDSSRFRISVICEGTTMLNDTVDSAGLFNIKFPDFNNDGAKDIMLTYGGNNFWYSLYLYNFSTNTYIAVEGFDRFPAAAQLTTDARYYYSYHRAGCADMNWVSDLFIIKNNKAIHLGHIYGQGCDADIQEEPQRIRVFKVVGDNPDNKLLLKTLPYNKHIPNIFDKWDFIHRYWNANFRRFR